MKRNRPLITYSLRLGLILIQAPRIIFRVAAGMRFSVFRIWVGMVIRLITLLVSVILKPYKVLLFFTFGSRLLNPN